MHNTYLFPTGSYGGRGGGPSNKWLAAWDVPHRGTVDTPVGTGEAGSGTGAGNGGGALKVDTAAGDINIDGIINANGKQ